MKVVGDENLVQFSIQQSLDLLASKACSTYKFGKCILPPQNGITSNLSILKGLKSALVKQLILFRLAFPTKVFPLSLSFIFNVTQMCDSGVILLEGKHGGTVE